MLENSIKKRVLKEYYNRVRKIWNSELYSKNKTVAYNIFTIPVLIPTFGILDWTKNGVLQIDINTRKLLTLSGSFHRNSSVDHLYMTRDDGGRGLNSIYDVFVARIISLSEHIKSKSSSHPLLKLVVDHEKEKLLRVSNQMKDNNSTPEDIKKL